ncbi:MAG: hypothetical protein HQK51_08875 [Oligoflexia bacterium]|nr:hypothetical protein [Oligoflexia bacterium]
MRSIRSMGFTKSMKSTKSRRGEQTNNTVLYLERLCLIAVMIFLLTFISGCGLFFPDRTYVDEMDKESEGYFVPGEDFPVVAGDQNVSGRNRKTIMERTPLSQKHQRKKMLEDALIEELKALEDSLPEQEYNHYLGHADKLPTISEKIFFLRLKGVRERNEYLVTRGYSTRKNNGADELNEELAVNNQEIIVGMSKDAVVQSWGRPMRIDVAGNPMNENERWLFYNYGKQKYVFFENGKVKGWVSE